MQLTKKEQQMFDGELGEAAAQSMEILVALGKIYGAERMVPVSSVQVAGVSYKTIGDAGLEYLQDLAEKGARVTVPSFLNPAGMDIAQWKEMGIPEDFAKRQIAVLDAYSKMGISRTCTCAPYLIGIRPKIGEHIAWAESSAVSFANSVLGARTNREGGPSALAAGICGVTPYYGLHLDENRIASVIIDVQCELKSTADFGALGSAIGKLAKRKYPAFRGIESASEEQLKVLGASMAATGSVPLYFVEGMTPEYKVMEDAEKISFGNHELDTEHRTLDTGHLKPDLVTIGCPHASLEEIKQVAVMTGPIEAGASMVHGTKRPTERSIRSVDHKTERRFIGRSIGNRKPTTQFWVCTSRKLKEEADRLGYTKKIEQAGGRIVADTCMVVCPLERMGFEITGTNSGKACKYLPNLCKQRVAFGDLEDILYR